MTRRRARICWLHILALLVAACGSQGNSRTRASESGGAGGSDAPSTMPQLDLSQAIEITASQGTHWKPMLVDSPSTEIFQIEARNTTEATLGISASLFGDDASEFGFESVPAFQSLGPGETVTVSVRYAPTSAGKKDASVQFAVWEPGNTTNRQIFAIALQAEAKSWSYVGQRGLSAGSAGSYLKATDPTNPARVGRPGDRSIALVADGDVLYLAYKDGSQLSDPSDTESGKLTVAQYVQGQWTTLGTPGFSDGDAMWLSLVVHQHIPYVGFVDGTAATVMKFDGQSWSPVGQKAFTPASAAYTALHVADNQGQTDLYLSFQDGAPHLEVNGTDRRGAVSVMHYQADSWSYLGPPVFTYPESAGASTSIAVAGGMVYVAYGSGLMRFDAATATWTKVGSFSASSTALSTDPAGELYIAIADLEREAKATVLSYTGGTLTALGTRGFSLGPAEFLSLGWNNESLLVAFKDGGNYDGIVGGAVAAEFLGGDWSVLGAGTASPGSVNHLSLTAAGGRIYLGYKDEDWPSAPAGEGTGKASVIVKE